MNIIEKSKELKQNIDALLVEFFKNTGAEVQCMAVEPKQLRTRKLDGENKTPKIGKQPIGSRCNSLTVTHAGVRIVV